MVKDLMIIGASGTGIQIAETVEDVNEEKKEWNFLGYLDDDVNKQGLEINGYPVLGPISVASQYDDCYFIVAICYWKNLFIRKKIVKELDVKKLDRFATIIHPGTKISRYAKIGKGTVVMPNTVIMPNVSIGNHVIILSNSYIAHNTIIEDYVTITNSVSICGVVKINEGCYIGANSSIRERVTIGEWSLIGMGSVILSDVPAFSTMIGNPGRFLRKIEPPECLE